MIVDELVTLLEFDVKGKDKAVSFGTIVQKIEESAKKLVLSLTAAVTSVAYFADRVSKEITDNYEWAKSVGVAADSYQRFEHAAEIVGGSLSDIKGDLEKWVRTAKASGMTLEEVYAREAKAIEGMSSDQAYQLLSAAGYSDTSIRMLQKGENELKQYFAQAEVIPEKHLKAAQDYAVTWRQVSSEVSKAMNAAVSSALPYLQSLLEGVRKFINTNKELFKSSVAVFFKSLTIVLIAFLTPLRYVIQAVFFLIRAFDKATFGIGKYIIVIGALTAAFTALSIAIAFKTVRSVATLMGLVPQLLAGSIQYFHLINRLVVKLATTNLQEAILNSELAAGVKMWWANTAAIWAQTKATAANTIQVIRNAFVAKAHLFTMKSLALAVQNLMRNLLVGTVKVFPKLIAQLWTMFLHLVKTTTLIATKTLVFLSRLIFAIGNGFVRGVLQAVAALKAFRLSMIGSMINQVFAAAVALKTSLIPALAAAKTAAISFSVALSANPIGLIAAAIALVVASIIIWIKYWRQILEIYKKIFNFLYSISKMLNPILIVLRAIRQTIQFYVSIITLIVKGVALIRKYWNDLPGLIKAVTNKIKEFFKELFGPGTIGDWLVRGLQWALSTAKELFVKFLGLVFDPYIEEINNIVAVLNRIPGVNIQQIRQFGAPAAYNGSASIAPNNYQNSRSYVDQRNITINTNATSGPAIASYMKSNDLVRGGYGASGVW